MTAAARSATAELVPAQRAATQSSQPRHSAKRSAALLLASLLLCAGCNSDAVMRMLGRPPMPDELPVMLNTESPFRYPVSLFAERVQGNVKLRLFVDSAGIVHADSTMVAASSGIMALDSAALLASRELTFAPARRKGRPLAVTIIYPVLYRHPDAATSPDDTLYRPITVRDTT